MAAGRLLSAKIGSGKARSRVLHSDLAPGGEEQQQQHRLFFSDSGEEEEDEEGHESDDSDLEDEFSSDSLSEWEDDGVDDEEDDVDDDDDAEEEEEEEAQQEKREGAHAPRAIIDRQDSHAQDNQWGRGWTHRFVATLAWRVCLLKYRSGPFKPISHIQHERAHTQSRPAPSYPRA